MRIAKRLTPVLAFLVVLSLAVPALAQTGGGYDLTWSTIDGGGGELTGGEYTLAGTVGQPEPGALTGGPYIAEGGFWAMFSETVYRIFLPLVLRNNP